MMAAAAIMATLRRESMRPEEGKGTDSESEVKTGDGTYRVIFPAGGIQEMVSNSPLQYCSDKAERH
jgi:hypothetical protein